MPADFELTTLAATVEIAPGVHMPRLGLGTYKSAEGTDAETAVGFALSAGYRLIDTAAVYDNERSIGRAIAASDVPRDEIFVTTKLWNTDQGYKAALAAFDLSLEKLGLDYVDLYLVHWPWQERMRETWAAMEEILSCGRARAIGVCNHHPHHLDELARSAAVMPAVNQCEFHPLLQQPALQAACRERGITLQAWAPLIRGRVNLIPELVSIASVHRKTPAQISLRWILQSGWVTIPKSVHERRIAENCDLYDFELSPEEMAIIGGLDDGTRIGPQPDGYAETHA
jgi:methylglyoxal/glyoxal reductase